MIKSIKKYLDRFLQKVKSGNFPDFMIIGAQKSGTSSLHNYLQQHPNLTAGSLRGSTNEMHYFDKLVHEGLSIDWYKNHFYKKSLKEQTYFETTPKYIYLEDVAKQIANIKTDVKFILILREPVKRAFTAWNMYYDFFKNDKTHKLSKNGSTYKFLYEGRTKFPSFLEAVKIEEKLMRDEISDTPSIIRRGFYAKQIKNYLKYFDREQILVLGFNELVNNTSSV